MSTKIAVSTREEWLQHKKSGIGASEIGAIMGVNPYMTPYDVWGVKTERESGPEENDAMLAGHLLEDAVANYFEIKSGHRVIKNTADEYLVVHPVHPHVMCSPDREYFHKDAQGQTDGRAVLECKTTQMPIASGLEIPRYWYTQLQYQMGILGLKRGSLAWLKRGIEFDYADFDFDQELFDRMITAVNEFWHNHILADTPPPAINPADIMKMYPIDDNEKLLFADNDLTVQIQRVHNLKLQEKELKKQIIAESDAVKMKMLDHTIVENVDGVLATWKECVSNRLDTKRLKAEKPEIYTEYIKESKTRRFIVK